MITVLLIDRPFVSTVKQISKSLRDEVFNAVVIETQITDIAPLLGEKLFNAILKAPADYTALLEGGDYTIDGELFTNYGLKTVIAYYFYARYKMFGDVIDTPFSSVSKTNENSIPTSEKTKKDLFLLNQQSGFTVWQSVENFLIRTEEPLYKNSSILSGNCITTHNPRLKISKIQ